MTRHRHGRISRILGPAAAAALIILTIPALWPAAADLMARADLAIGLPVVDAEVRDRVTVVTIPVAALDQLRFDQPVARDFLADVVDGVAARGATSIGLYLPLTRPTEPEADADLARALAAHRPVVLWDPTATSPDGFQMPFLEGLPRGVSGFRPRPGRPLDRVRLVTRTPAGSETAFAAVLAARAGVPVTDLPGVMALAADGPARMLSVLALRDVPEDAFRDRIVLIGVDLPSARGGERYRLRVPMTADGGAFQDYPGVAVQARTLVTILAATVKPVLPASWAICLVLVMAIVGAAIVDRVPRARERATPPWPALVISAVGLSLVVTAVAVLARDTELPLLPATASLGAGLLALALGRAWRGAEARLTNLDRGLALDGWLPASGVGRWDVGPARTEATLLECRLEHLDGADPWDQPERMARALASHLTGLSERITEAGGTLLARDEAGVRAVFGAPLRQPEHGEPALRCALALTAAAANRSWRLRATLLTGDMLSVFDPDRRPPLIVMAGPAARSLEAVSRAARRIGVPVLVSRETVLSVRGATDDGAPDLVFRPVGALRLAGHPTPIQLETPVTAEGMGKIARLEAYLDAYAAMESEAPDSVARFRALLATAPEDPLVAFHLQRLTTGELGTAFTVQDR